MSPSPSQRSSGARRVKDREQRPWTPCTHVAAVLAAPGAELGSRRAGGHVGRAEVPLESQ